MRDGRVRESVRWVPANAPLGRIPCLVEARR